MNVVIRALLIVVLTAGIVGLAGCSSKTPVAPLTPDGSTDSSSTTVPTATPSEPSTPAGLREDQAVVYFMDSGEKLVPVRVAAESTDREDTLERLFDGPNAEARAAGLTTSIPAGTKLLGLRVAGGTATVDVSREYGSGGGSLSMMSRIAQVVFTLTREPDVKRVAFEMNGTPIEALGGEGIISKPQTRTDWEDFSPAVLIESPVLGDSIESPVSLSGTANVFEARFQISVRNAQGSPVVDRAVQATSGTGTRGTFDTEVAFDLPAGTKVTLVAWYASAKDGSPVVVMSVPVVVR